VRNVFVDIEPDYPTLNQLESCENYLELGENFNKLKFNFSFLFPIKTSIFILNDFTKS
jgi:hypothetical protein